MTTAELFAPAPPRAATSSRWAGCCCCGRRDGLRAHVAHDICLSCVTEPAAVRGRLEAQRRALIGNQRDAARTAQAAWDALPEDEQARWGRFAALRGRKDSGDALTPIEVRQLADTHAAYRAPQHARISEGLRRYYADDECLHWANLANEHGQRGVNAKLAQLALCIEAMEAQP